MGLRMQIEKIANMNLNMIFAAVFDWISKQHLIFYCFCQIFIAESLGWQIYLATARKWRQIRKMFLSLIKGITVEIEIITALFQRCLKQQVNFQLLF